MPDTEIRDNDDDSTKLATTENVSLKHNKCINFVKRTKLFYSRKLSRHYNFKIVLEALQESVDVFLVQCFKNFFKKC